MSKEAIEQPILLTRRAAAALLSISERSLDYAIQRGEIKVRRAGRKVLVPRSEVERYARRDHEALRMRSTNGEAEPEPNTAPKTSRRDFRTPTGDGDAE